MFFYILNFFLIIVIPITVGGFLSLILHELYQRQLAEKAKEETQLPQQKEDITLNLYDLSLDADASGNTEDEIKAEQPQSQIEESISEIPTAVAEQPPQSEQPKESEEPEKPEPGLESVFKDPEVSLDMFKINEVLDAIVKEDMPEVPPDLSSRLEEEDKPEILLEQFNKTNTIADSDSIDDEILAKTIESGRLSSEPLEIDPVTQQNPNSLHPDISPQSVELFGEDFDFDALLNQKPKTEPNIEKSAEALIPTHEIGPGIYQADGMILSTNQTLFEQLEIVSSFPESLIQDTVIKPDDAARKFNFTEESLPMFVRKKKK